MHSYPRYTIVFAREVTMNVCMHVLGLLKAFGTPSHQAGHQERDRNVVRQHAVCADSFGISTRRDRDSFAIMQDNRGRD